MSIFVGRRLSEVERSMAYLNDYPAGAAWSEWFYMYSTSITASPQSLCRVRVVLNEDRTYNFTINIVGTQFHGYSHAFPEGDYASEEAYRDDLEYYVLLLRLGEEGPWSWT